MSKHTPSSFNPPKKTYRSTQEFLNDDSCLQQSRSGGNNGSPFPKDDNYRSVSVVRPSQSLHAVSSNMNSMGSFLHKSAMLEAPLSSSSLSSLPFGRPSHGKHTHTSFRGSGASSSSLLFGSRGSRRGRGIPMAPAKPLLLNQKTSFECRPDYSSKYIINALTEVILDEGVDIRHDTESTITGEFYPNHSRCCFNVNLYRTAKGTGTATAKATAGTGTGTGTGQQYVVEFQKLSGCTGKFLELYRRIITKCGEFVPQSAIPKGPCIRRSSNNNNNDTVSTLLPEFNINTMLEAENLVSKKLVSLREKIETESVRESRESKSVDDMKNLKHLIGLLTNPYSDVKTMAAIELACATDSRSTADALVMSAILSQDDDVTIQSFFDTVFQILRGRACEDVRRCLFAVLLNVVQAYTRLLTSLSCTTTTVQSKSDNALALEGMKPKLQDARIVIERAAEDSNELRLTRAYAQQIVTELDLVLI